MTTLSLKILGALLESASMFALCRLLTSTGLAALGFIPPEELFLFLVRLKSC